MQSSIIYVSWNPDFQVIWILTQQAYLPHISKILESFLRGNCTPYQKLAWFVLYLKIVNTFLKMIYAPLL